MSGGISATTVIAAASAAATIYSAVSQKGKGGTPKAPEIAKPPEAAKTPDVDVFKTKNAAAMGGRGSASSTLLTPMGGVPDTSLNLGKNTLLGA
jgi:hypothetical protein